MQKVIAAFIPLFGTILTVVSNVKGDAFLSKPIEGEVALFWKEWGIPGMRSALEAKGPAKDQSMATQRPFYPFQEHMPVVNFELSPPAANTKPGFFGKDSFRRSMESSAPPKEFFPNSQFGPFPKAFPRPDIIPETEFFSPPFPNNQDQPFFPGQPHSFDEPFPKPFEPPFPPTMPFSGAEPLPNQNEPNFASHLGQIGSKYYIKKGKLPPNFARYNQQDGQQDPYLKPVNMGMMLGYGRLGPESVTGKNNATSTAATTPNSITTSTKKPGRKHTMRRTKKPTTTTSTTTTSTTESNRKSIFGLANKRRKTNASKSQKKSRKPSIEPSEKILRDLKNW